MKAVVIGSGLAGLTAAAYLVHDGHDVTVYEQSGDVGGVTGGFSKDGFSWDMGQLILEGFGPGEQAAKVLDELGLRTGLKLTRQDRVYSFPDFVIEPPETYEGPWWRQEFFARLFPGERRGLKRYYRYYRRFMEIVTRARTAETSTGLTSILATAGMYLKLLPLLPRAKWNAKRMTDAFFTSEKLKAAFISILADFTVKPSDFPGLGIAAVNPEAAFDRRVPLKTSRHGKQASYHFIDGGCRALTDQLVEKITAGGGRIETGALVSRIVADGSLATGVELADGRSDPADLIIASGGAREVFYDLVGEDKLPQEFSQTLADISLMESIFMIHLAVDFDPRPWQSAGVCYYYLTYDIETSVEKLLGGIYHGGHDGFMICIPSYFSPAMAPEGSHAVTIYTVAPDTLKDGTWESKKDQYTAQLLDLAEEKIPGLRANTRFMEVFTPEDFRRLTNLKHHAFGGCAPVMGKNGAPHVTPFDNLWFVGAQSESGAGMNNVIEGVWRTIRNIRKGATRRSTPST
jgi:phytoene dehydrogenase-like protein